MLAARGWRVRAGVRTSSVPPPAVDEVVTVGDLGPHTDWAAAVSGVDSVVHLAARAHILNRPHDADEYLQINGEGTGALARAAAAAHVRRFVYLSSIKVYGDHDRPLPFTLDDVPVPTDVYGHSKLAGERLLPQNAGSMQTVVVRPPLIYGPEVRANFLRLMKWVDRQLPLPLGAVRNVRSLVALDNLCDFLGRALEHPQAGTWLVSDAHDVSTPDLIREIAQAMGRKSRLLHVPPRLLRATGAMVGKGADVMRMCGSLSLDVSASRARLAWTPPLTFSKGIEVAVRWYLDTRPSV
jgi:nucleoside-diphosphate-sugar epimerase